MLLLFTVNFYAKLISFFKDLSESISKEKPMPQGSSKRNYTGAVLRKKTTSHSIKSLSSESVDDSTSPGKSVSFALLLFKKSYYICFFLASNYSF